MSLQIVSDVLGEWDLLDEDVERDAINELYAALVLISRPPSREQLVELAAAACAAIAHLDAREPDREQFEEAA